MKFMEEVLVCWDGKLGRAKVGTIIKTSNGNKILVRYQPHYEDDIKTTDQWFKVIKKNRGVKKWGGMTTEHGWCAVFKKKYVLSKGLAPYWESK